MPVTIEHQERQTINMSSPITYQDIFVNELEQWRSRGARIIDVREGDEFAQGHLPGAENIPLGELEEKAATLGGELVVVCASGGRSATAARYLSELGKSGVANLVGGTFGYAQRHVLERL